MAASLRRLRARRPAGWRSRHAQRGGAASRRRHRRQAVHLVPLAGAGEEACPRSDSQRHGTVVTRGWPLNPRPGERVDHPHHVGLWFNYENVNGLDFWNNSDAIKPAGPLEDGHDRPSRIVSAQGGAERGELTTDSDWVTAGRQESLLASARSSSSRAMPRRGRSIASRR
jgi:hypothetical protein